MSQATTTTTIPIYERMLDADLRWALNEGGMHFENQSAVHKTLRKLARRLDELSIPYALVGGMAMFYHGFRRFTEDVDILVTPEDLNRIHEKLEGLGYVRAWAGAKNLRDTEYGVRIEFLKTGEYPGDGKPKPIAFPRPEECAEVIEGIRCVRLPTFVELKLASGMASHRRRDLADIQDLIRTLNLPAEFAEHLNPYVRDLYTQLWNEVHEAPPDP